MDWILLAVVIILIGYILKSRNQKQISNEEAEEKTPSIDYSKSYQKKYLLTKNEYYAWKKLNAYAQQAEMIVCPKVRLLDIIEPQQSDYKTYTSRMRKIQSKHVDFVICDNSLRVLGVIELDDNSHNTKDRQERDAFVDQILQSVGYTVVHTRGVTESTLDAFKPKRAAEQTTEI